MQTMKNNKKSIQDLTINTLRILSVQAIAQADSGHPGIALGAAPMAYSLWVNCMSHNPKDSKWHNRDRFVLSAGHGSALLYSLLTVFGYDLELQDLQQFRQLGSKTPGHPEYGMTDGVEVSTGPLGQGLANAVGLAQAESILAARFNKPDLNIVDHYTYCIASDGDLMEGISYEAASLAGVWQLSKLIVLYDSNNISIEGNTNIAFGDDISMRFGSMGWFVQSIDGMDCEQVVNAINIAKTQSKPSLIVCKTTIGYGSDKAGTSSIHGSPLNEQGITKLRQNLGYTTPGFSIDPQVTQHIDEVVTRLQLAQTNWHNTLDLYKTKYPQDFVVYEQYMQGKDTYVADALNALSTISTKDDSTRNISGRILNALSQVVPNMVGGSADLAPSNKTSLKDKGDYSASDRLGRNIHYGVREHAMISISNGMLRHGGLVNFVSTFFVFSDYAKNAIRMSSIMELPSLFVLTHDSIGVGEDGCTHQPIEQLIGLRSIPGLRVFRPADTNETIAGFASWLQSHQPHALVLSRQDLPTLPSNVQDALKGGYIISQSKSPIPQLILIATGSEVQYALSAQAVLYTQGIDSQVVSMPCCELFDSQPDWYRQHVLPDTVRARIAIEAGNSYGWYRYVGLDGRVIGIDRFGISGKDTELFKHFGFGVDNIVKVAQSLIGVVLR
jgi:transketolase